MPAAKKSQNKFDVVLDVPVPKKHVVRFEKVYDKSIGHHAEHGISPVYVSNELHKKLGSPEKVKVTIEAVS
jgi:hypothetical protein